MVNRPILTSTETSRRRRAIDRLGLPHLGQGHRLRDPDDANLQAAVGAYKLLGEHIDRYQPGDDLAASLAYRHADGYAVVIDGYTVHTSDPTAAAELALGARRFARILPLAQCRTQGAP